MKHSMGPLDRIANDMTAWLLAIAIGLGMLDLTVLAAKSMPALPPLPAAAASQTTRFPKPADATPRDTQLIARQNDGVLGFLHSPSAGMTEGMHASIRRTSP